VAEYRTPLPALLAAMLESGINRVLALDSDAAQRLSRLQGRLLEVELEGLGIELFMGFEYGSVLVSVEAGQEADTVVSGTPMALFMMAAPDDVGDWGLPGSGVRIQGDANLARDLGKVFSQLDLDWEGPLSGLLGDTLGFQVASGLRQGVSAARSAAQTLSSQLSDYFRNEPGAVVAKPEMRGFEQAVDELRDGVDRLEARLKRFEDKNP
jgi:ubiquinone biosynthesis protein UbiJ